MGTVTRLDAEIAPPGGRTAAPSKRALVLTASVLAPTAVAVALIPWRSRLDTADCALFLVVAIVAVASTGNRVAALVSAFVAALSFDFFLTRPYYSFRISRHQDLITELLLLVVGVAVGELAARGRAHQKAASESRKTVALLHSATESMATGQEPQAVIDHASAELMQLLSLRSCFFTRQHPVNISARITAQGEVMVGTQSWDTDDLGLPTSRVYLPVRAQGWLLGHFVLTPTQGRPVAAQQLLAAVAIADLVGAVLLADDSGSIPVNQGSLEDPADPEGKNLGAQHV